MSNGDNVTLSIGSVVGLIAGVALMGLGAYRLLTFGAVKNATTTLIVLQYAGAVLIFFGGLILVGIVYRGMRKLVR
ncbi:MAG: hypothetical protein Q8P50_04700 [Bacillota bacterium]|nr:hypothetical protein [Bacillota bacterium]